MRPARRDRACGEFGAVCRHDVTFRVGRLLVGVTPAATGRRGLDRD
jgi:hypothetical protein